MKKLILFKQIKTIAYFIILFGSNLIIAQVGIGTTNPAPSSVLEVASTTQGMLTPRMTTAQKNAIASPANGLMVFDTDLKAFYYYDSSINSWNKINSNVDGRLKYKLIKSTDVLATVLAAELIAGGTTKYLLDIGTYYEINGTITFNLPIDLNNAYISGEDANEDKLIKTSGNLFDGATGGTVRNVTITVTGAGSKVFNLSGNAAQNFIIRDAIIAGCTNVGSITGFGLVFVSIVQYVGNGAGIVYDSISKLLLSNAAWFSNNTGTYERLQGAFGLVQKQGGFSEVTGANIGFDVSSNPTITGDAILESVVFTGALTTGKYVNGYSPATYAGYNFNSSWNVRSAGIPTETDAVASSSIYQDRTQPLSTGPFTNTGTIYLLSGTTIGTNLFRMSSPVTNRIVYQGKKPRNFSANASVSFEGGSGATDLLFFFVKFSADGSTFSIVENSNTFIDSNTSNVQSFSINGSVSLATGEYVQIGGQRINGSNKTFTFQSYNMTLR